MIGDMGIISRNHRQETILAIEETHLLYINAN
jgi:hypothetical protein